MPRLSTRPLRVLPVLVACTVALLLTAAITSAQDAGLPDAGGADYLALGDSLAFGFDPLVDPKAATFIGYPEVLASRLDLDVTNASCPGEATGGFVSLLGSDDGCQPYRATPFPLHIGYSTAQLDFAVAFLRAHPDTRLVTLDIGANDLFALQRQCAATTDSLLCIATGVPSMLQRLANNLQTIYSRIRGDAHYTHQIVALTYYALDSSDPLDVALIESINATVANATLQAHGQVADGFRAFRTAAQAWGGDACAAGLLVVTRSNPLTCDIHPSAQGRNLLASAIQDVVQEHDSMDSVIPGHDAG